MKMNEHQLINPDHPITSGALMILGVIVLVLLLGWMRSRDLDPEAGIECPQPKHGQELIGRGHVEFDGEPGELRCVYSTAPVYKHLVASK